MLLTPLQPFWTVPKTSQSSAELPAVMLSSLLTFEPSFVFTRSSMQKTLICFVKSFIEAFSLDFCNQELPSRTFRSDFGSKIFLSCSNSPGSRQSLLNILFKAVFSILVFLHAVVGSLFTVTSTFFQLKPSFCCFTTLIFSFVGALISFSFSGVMLLFSLFSAIASFFELCLSTLWFDFSISQSIRLTWLLILLFCPIFGHIFIVAPSKIFVVARDCLSGLCSFFPIFRRLNSSLRQNFP